MKPGLEALAHPPQHAGEVRVVEGNHLRAVAPPRDPRQILPLRSCEVVRGEAQPQVPVHVRALVLLGLHGVEEPCSSSFLGQEVGRPPRIRGTLLKPLFGATSGVFRPPCIQGTLSKPFFWAINGGAEGPGQRLQREGPAEAVPTREAARPRRDAGHGLRGAEGRRGPAGAGVPAARAGQVGRRGAQRPAAGRPHRLQPEHAGEDEVRPGGDGRLHPGGRRGTSAEQERRDGGPHHQARRKGADGGRRELRGHDRPGQRVRHAGPGAARGGRAPHEAARGPQRHCRGGPGHPDAEEGPGHEGGAQAYNARPHETVHGAPEDVERQPATEFRVLQDNADKFQHNKDLTDRRVKAVEDVGAFRAPTNAARSFNPQYGDVQRLGAVDSMTVRSTEGRETLLKLALPAPGSGNGAG